MIKVNLILKNERYYFSERSRRTPVFRVIIRVLILPKSKKCYKFVFTVLTYNPPPFPNVFFQIEIIDLLGLLVLAGKRKKGRA